MRVVREALGMSLNDLGQRMGVSAQTVHTQAELLYDTLAALAMHTMALEDLQGLIPTDVATRGDLDLAELENILDARAWAYRRTWKPEGLLDSYALADLHRRMFGQVWRWAGTWRNRQTSIGIVMWQSTAGEGPQSCGRPRCETSQD